LTSQRGVSIKSSKLSSLPVSPSIKSHHKEKSLLNHSLINRYASPIMHGGRSEFNEREFESIENIAKMTTKFRNLKVQTNRPLYVDGTPIQGDRFAKRMFFVNKQTEKDVFNANLAMISQKEEVKKVKTLVANEDEDEEESLLENKVQQIKEEYTAYNVSKAKEKQMLKSDAFHAKKKEKYSFFPFTEGEKVEKRRTDQKINLTKELRERSRQQKDSNTLSPTNKPRSKRNSSFVKSNDQTPLSKFNRDEILSQNSGFSCLNSSFYPNGQRQAPESFNSSYPKFLEPHKFHPYRRLDDSHIEKVMNDAVKRVEEQVNNVKKRRAKQSREFEERMRTVLREVDKDFVIKQNDLKTLQEFQKGQINTKQRKPNLVKMYSSG